MSVGGSRPRSVFYCNPSSSIFPTTVNGSNESQNVKSPIIPPRSSTNEKSEGQCKASFTNQGFCYEGTILVTNYRVVFVCDDEKVDPDSVSQDERGNVFGRRNTNCGQKMITFYDEYLDIPLTQIRRVFIVQQEPGATSQSASSSTGYSTTSGSPTKPNLRWLPFPSQFEPLMDFLYIQIECSNFNCCTIHFEKSETSYQQFLSSLASRLTHQITDAGNFLFMNVAEALKFAELSSSTEAESHRSFLFLKDWISFFHNSFLVNILKDEDKIGQHGNICSIIASAIILQLYSKNLSIEENFPQFCLSIKHGNQSDKYLMRYVESVPSGSVEFTGRSSFSISKSPLKSFLSQNKHQFDIMEVTEQLTFSAKSLSHGYELLEEYIQFRFGRSRKFFKMSIKLFRTIFENSGWLSAVSNCLKCASVVAQKCQSSNKDIFILKNASGVGFGISCILTSLVEVLLSSECRTVSGLIEVVQRHWIAAGFDFKEQFMRFTDGKPKCLKRYLEDRKSSIASSKRMTKNLLKFGTIFNPGDEQAVMARTPTPYFLVFLDCVHQLTRLYPTYFEFNSPYLSQIWNFLLSGVFSDFLEPKTQSLRPSLWECINESPNAHLFRNPLYLQDYLGEDMRPQLDAKTYCSANLEVWDDVFFRYHIDCSTVVLSVDDKNNSKIVFSNTRECFLKPPPNYLERNTSFESSLQHVYEMMDVINVKMTENEQTEDQSDWVLPKKSFHSDVNPRSFARVASSIEICDLLESGDEEDMPDGLTSNNLEIRCADRSSSRESTLFQDWGKFSMGGNNRGLSIQSTGGNRSTDEVESSTESFNLGELVTIKSTQL